MLFTWLVLISSSVPSFAFVPEYATIASRAAEQHGRGAYQIEQEVSYRKGADVFTVKETWQVANEGNLRLTLEGRGSLKGLVTGTLVYENSTRFLSDDGRSIRSQRLGEEWLEPLFHFRSSKWLRQRLVALKVTQEDSLRDRPPLNSDGTPAYEVPSFIRLARTGGSIAWAIGAPPSAAIVPTIWIEQDQFVVRKFRGASQVVLKADEYAKHDDGFWYPRTRIYTFGDKTVSVQTLSVRPLGKIPPSDNRFKSASLNPSRDSIKLPDTEGLREFYARFR